MRNNGPGAPGVADLDYGAALVFVLTAVSVFGLDRYRKSHPKKIVDPGSQHVVYVPRVDDFYYLNLRIWAVILLLVAAAFTGMGLFGFAPFK